ncbi:hypothetical protein FO519_009015 [Halicephalobus sp. NKZ332]|nr:hypothetical protein FO519_009015 [Halicephalobus sp. NKZ332]
MTEAEDKIREVVVIPEIDSVQSNSNLSQIFTDCSEYFIQKIEDSRKVVKECSAVSFMVNSLQSRIVTTDLCTKLTKVYEALDVRKMDDFESKFGDLKANPASEEDSEAFRKFEEATNSWDNFLAEIDAEIEKVAGPLSGLGPEDNIPLGKNKTVQSGTLLAYIKSSSFGMLFIQVVTSFSSPEASELVLKSYEKLPEFQRLNCDILLLTKGSGGEGSGFLKLVGVPFRMLLNEQESLSRILQHRQSALSIAGVRALHLFTEIICNAEALDFVKLESDSSELPGVGAFGGCILVDRGGNVLYNYTCTDNSNWPDVEVLLEQVKINKKAIDEKSPPMTITRSGSLVKGDTVLSESTKATDDMNVAVSKNKCCTIL